ELPRLELHVLRCGLQQVGGDPLPFLDQLVRAHGQRGAAYRAAATPVGAHPERNATRVAVHDLHVVESNSQARGDDLCERGLVTLTLRLAAGEDRHFPGRMDANRSAFVEARLCTEGSHYVRRSEAARLDVRADADPDVPALLPQPRLLLTQLRILDHLQGPVQRRLVVP